MAPAGTDRQTGACRNDLQPTPILETRSTLSDESETILCADLFRQSTRGRDYVSVTGRKPADPATRLGKLVKFNTGSIKSRQVLAQLTQS